MEIFIGLGILLAIFAWNSQQESKQMTMKPLEDVTELPGIFFDLPTNFTQKELTAAICRPGGPGVPSERLSTLKQGDYAIEPYNTLDTMEELRRIDMLRAYRKNEREQAAIANELLNPTKKTHDTIYAPKSQVKLSDIPF